MSKLRVGIIGTGGISRSHAEGYLQLSDRAEIAACCDLDIEKAKKWTEHFGIPECHVYQDYREMLEKEKLDAVSVCTWNAAHKECTIAALEAGCHVLCEKPMAMNAAEAQEMSDTAKRCGKLLQVGFVRRFGEETELFRKMQEQGDSFGEIYYAKARCVRRDGCPGGWFSDKRYSGGGPVIDLGVHMIDLCRYLAGNPEPDTVFARTFTGKVGFHRGEEPGSYRSESSGDYQVNIEEMGTAMIVFRNGFTLQVEAAFAQNQKEKEILSADFYGTKAGIHLQPGFEYYKVEAGNFVNVQPAVECAFDFSKSFCREIRNFVLSCEGEETPRADARDGIMLMKILDGIYESAETGRSVKL